MYTVAELVESLRGRHKDMPVCVMLAGGVKLPLDKVIVIDGQLCLEPEHEGEKDIETRPPHRDCPNCGGAGCSSCQY